MGFISEIHCPNCKYVYHLAYRFSHIDSARKNLGIKRNIANIVIFNYNTL